MPTRKVRSRPRLLPDFRPLLLISILIGTHSLVFLSPPPTFTYRSPANIVPNTIYTGTVSSSGSVVYFLPPQTCPSTVTVQPTAGDPDLYISSLPFSSGVSCPSGAFCTSSKSVRTQRRPCRPTHAFTFIEHVLSFHSTPFTGLPPNQASMTPETLTFNSALLSTGFYIAVAGWSSTSAFTLQVVLQCGNAMSFNSPCASSGSGCGACPSPQSTSCSACFYGGGTFNCDNQSASGSIPSGLVLVFVIVPLIVVFGLLSCCCCQGWCVSVCSFCASPALSFNACCPTLCWPSCGQRYDPNNRPAASAFAVPGSNLPPSIQPRGGPQQPQQMNMPPSIQAQGYPQHQQQVQMQPAFVQYGLPQQQAYAPYPPQQYQQQQQQQFQPTPYGLPQYQAASALPPQYTETPGAYGAPPVQPQMPMPLYSQQSPQQQYLPHALPAPAIGAYSDSYSGPGAAGGFQLPQQSQHQEPQHMPASISQVAPAPNSHMPASIGGGKHL